MRFKMNTLVDITSTGARRGEGKSYHQEQNYMTVVQTIALRANPENVCIYTEKQTLKSSLFGKKFKGNHTVWCMEFDIEYENATTIEILENDFNFVPFINNLEETAEFENSVFVTKNPDNNNVFFEQLDK